MVDGWCKNGGQSMMGSVLKADAKVGWQGGDRGGILDVVGGTKSLGFCD